MRALEPAVPLSRAGDQVRAEGLLAVRALDLGRLLRGGLVVHLRPGYRRRSGQRDRLDPDLLARLVPRAGVGVRDRVHDVHAGGDLPEHGVLAVEPRACVGRHDEELRAVRVRPRVRHRERAALDLVVVELVLELVTGAAAPGAGWIAGLDHEVRYHAV